MAVLNDLSNMEKPREKAIQFGLRSLSSVELIALILRTGTKGKSVLELAQEVLNKTGGISGLAKADIYELSEISGISKTKALELLASFEMCRRMRYEEALHTDALHSPAAIVRWLELEIGVAHKEMFLVLFLDSQFQMLGYKTLFEGTANQSHVYEREIFREAVIKGCTNLILVHNHPSGNVDPSQADLYLTGKMIVMGEMMGVHICDHLIVSDRDYFSFSKNGVLDLCVDEVVEK